MILNDSDKMFLVYNEDTLPIERFAQIFKCKCQEVIDKYDELFYTGEYYIFQTEKLRTRGVR